ncbi:hypothetical protein [Primorskyibacter sedentarius]|uniref:hypothetical protein n=1 Tax=Primorskyibacter sedentarius TaxID=745311 RepID=UPI003EB94C25
MPMITPKIEDNPRLREVGHAFTPASFLEAAGAGVEDMLVRSPTSSLARMGELSDAAELGDPTPNESPLFGTMPRPDRKPRTPLTEEDWKASRYYRKGLEYVPGMTDRMAEILATRKDSERRRQDILSRAPDTLLARSGILGVQVVAAVLDPVNVASAFIPVLRPVAFASLAARFGIIFARFGRGAIEGAAGAALVEPVVLAAARQEQADYDMTDSLINVAFGSVFGGGLHVAGGAIGDYLARTRPVVREQALRTAVAQAVDGRPVDVDPILRAADVTPARQTPAPKSLDPVSTIPKRAEAFDAALRELKAELLPVAGNVLKRGDVKTLKAELSDVRFRIQQAEEAPLAPVKDSVKRTVQRTKGRAAAKEAKAIKDKDVAALREQADRIERKLADAERAAAGRSLLSRIETFERQGKSAEDIVADALPRVEGQLQGVDTGRIQAQLTPDALGIGPVDGTPLTRESLRRAAAHNDSPQADPLADFPAAERVAEQADAADQTAKVEPSEFVSEAAAELDEVIASDAVADITAAERAALQRADDLIAQAKAFEVAARVAARCLGRAA